ncbi:O-fucosyltransferase 37 [Actinidia eriantha]|uniref:O-fucosyltransferase 37 n=1 Tax=Actinidia eriantha TaxID=165200 RepID=UPI0025903897|nr:O-fucosyltransferase 37 [Actinidia eriantha]
MARRKNLKNSLVTLYPSFVLHLISLSPFNSLISTPKKSPSPKTCSSPNLSLFFLSLLILFAFLGLSLLGFIPTSQNSVHCSVTSPSPVLDVFSDESDYDEPRLSRIAMVPLPAHRVSGNLTGEEREFWRQPDNEGYRPCLGFSIEYRRESARVSKEKRRFVVVVVSGGLNQQRNQIIDAVIIARILEAALVVPVLQVNHIWGDESEFSDIFDVEHFKKTLQADVRVVSSLPSTHLVSRQTVETQIPRHAPPLWIRTKFLNRLKQEGVLVLKGLDSKLAKNLPPDLQKLRCKVAFHALRYAAPIRELGNMLARRMWIEGPYISIHMRLEKDVWVRTGCLSGLGREYDDIIARERDSRPEFLTGKLNMSHVQRRLAGLCPLNGLEVARLLKALGAPKNARIYVAGGEPFGGSSALKLLVMEFPNVVRKEMLAREGELGPYTNRSSVLAAIDYIVSLSSDVFVPSHGGNMVRAMQGHRAYVGHRKFIKPNKRAMLPFIEGLAISDAEFSSTMKKLHKNSQGQPEMRNNKRDRDVVAYPVPECMCK